MIVAPYAGPGGWSVAIDALGIPGPEIGIEWDAAACATRAAAGFLTVRADVGKYPTEPFRGRCVGFIASPPCPAFSSAGKGEGRALLPEILEAVERRDWSARPSDDPLVWLTIDLGRWLTDLDPEWIACEQVPAVLPVWQAYARLLRDRGYSSWAGVLNSADYGVPQTRRRAILIASRSRVVEPPAATHAADPTPMLFGDQLKPWVTMAEALGWGMDEYAAPTLTAGGTRTGGAEPFGPERRRMMARERNEGRWRVGFPRLDDRGDSEDGYRERDWRDAATEPAFALTEKARSWVVNTGMRWQGSRESAQQVNATTQPAPTVTTASAGQWQITPPEGWPYDRPATTVACDPRVWPPGHKINQGDRDRLGDEAAAERYGDRAGSDAIRLSVRDALLLQSFPEHYPVTGSKSKQFEQIGNAVPPLLAAHVLAAVAT